MSMDRIGNLPDEIICHVVSFLSAKEAAFARSLSKRWGNLFQIIPDLTYVDSVGNAEESFERFVHEIMALPVAQRVRGFSLTCLHASFPNDDEDDLNRCLLKLPRWEQRINRCIRHLVLKRGVVALKINLEDAANYSLPGEVFTCKTVSTMKLGSGFVIDALPGDVSLPSLKSLYLDSVRFYASHGRCSFQSLLSASPVLEELVIDGVEWGSWKWCCTVSSTSLRRLTIRRREWRPEFEGIYLGGLSFDTPALQYLYYADYVRTEYPIANMNSLVEANLYYIQPRLDGNWDTVCWDDYIDVYNPINLIHGIKNVEILEVDSTTIDMFHAFRGALPVFEKLHKLSVDLDADCWTSLVVLMEKCPNLKTLNMESLHTGRKEDGCICPCVSEFSFLLHSESCPLEVLNIKTYRGTEREVKQMELLMEKASSLKSVKVAAQVPRHKQLQLMEDLAMLHRASTSCIIEVKFKLVVRKI